MTLWANGQALIPASQQNLNILLIRFSAFNPVSNRLNSIETLSWICYLSIHIWSFPSSLPILFILFTSLASSTSSTFIFAPFPPPCSPVSPRSVESATSVGCTNSRTVTISDPIGLIKLSALLPYVNGLLDHGNAVEKLVECRECVLANVWLKCAVLYKESRIIPWQIVRSYY